MKLRHKKERIGIEVLKKYNNWTSQTNFRELNDGCAGCGACSCGSGCTTAHDYPCDCNGCSSCGMTIKRTNKILVNK